MRADEYKEEEIDLVEVILLLLANKRFIIKATFYTFLLSIVISLLLPNIYKSSAKILPPQSLSALPPQLSSAISDIPITIPGKTDYSALYSQLVKTNDVIDYAIEKNNLREVYKTKDKEETREKVLDNIIVETDKKSGIITISYLSKDPELSYKVVVSLLEGLKRLNDRLAITQASQKRLFYEQQLNNAKEALIRSEEELRRFQLKTGSIKIDEELKGVVEEISTIRARISANEVKLKVLQSYATPQNPEYKALLDETNALKEQLSKLQSRLPSDDDALLSTSKASRYGIEYIRKMREFKYNESLYEILLKQYEFAKLEEAKDPTIIQIIENPEIPLKKFKPKRRYIVVISTFVAFMLSILWVFIKTFIEELKKDESRYQKINEIKRDFSIRDVFIEILSDIKGLTKKIRGIT